MILFVIGILKKLAIDRILKSLMYGNELEQFKDHINMKESAISMLKETIELKDKLIAQKESLLSEQGKYVKEKEEFLAKLEDQVVKEKESLAGKNSMEIKRDIILPSLKEKWEAEKKKIDAERSEIIKATPAISISLSSMKSETELIIKTIKGKPNSTSNHDLLLKNEGRLSAIEEIIFMVDKERGI